jgi:hypothetical protein
LGKCYYAELSEGLFPDIFYYYDETKAKDFIDFLNTIPEEYLTERMVGKIPWHELPKGLVKSNTENTLRELNIQQKSKE